MNADLMSTIEAIQQQTDSAGIREIMYDTIENYGFHRFTIWGLPDRIQDVPPFMLLSGWDDEWYERYTGLGYMELDPVARNCLSTSRPFFWSDAPYDREVDLPARRVMEEARDFGMDDGFCIPVHMNGALQGVVSLAGKAGELDEKGRLELHMLALYAHGQLRFLNGTSRTPGFRGTITSREGEVLKWVAAGKTAAEIADITGLSARTVNQHCENAQHRLGTNNRVHTVVEAIRHKLIVL